VKIMNKEKTSNQPIAMFFGVLTGVWVLTILIYAGVFVPGFKAALASTFTHHWLGKVIISYVALFSVWILSSFSLRNREVQNKKTWVWITVISIILSVFLISALMTWHYFTE